MEQTLTLNINGQQHTVTTDPDRPLLDVLREDLGLTGAKFGCGERQCGACTVLANGRPIFSCSTRVTTVAGRKIETIEGLADGDSASSVATSVCRRRRRAVWLLHARHDHDGGQLAPERSASTEEKIRSEMQRNVCRCGTYTRIIAAVERAAGGAA